MPSMIKFQVRLANFMSTIGKTKDTEVPRKSNVEYLLGTAYMWDFIASYAKGRSDIAWKELEDEEIIEPGELEPGQHLLAESPAFVCKASVTEKVRRFTADTLADKLYKSKWKVPKADTLRLVEAAKIPTSSQVKLSIVER